MSVSPYLFFDGQCENAIDFYKTALGAEVQNLMRFRDSPHEGHRSLPPGMDDKVMHAALRIRGSQVMVSDGMCSNQAPSFKGISLTIETPDSAEAETLFGALSDGGQVHQPLEETFFSARFGVVADKFGVNWMVVAPPKT